VCAVTIRHLQIFRTVCSCLSITRAAELLNMTQPAVSIAVRELETHYQTRLFDRIGRRIYLTEAGRALLRYAESILEQMDEAASVLRDSGSFPKCRIGVNVTVGETVLPEMLCELQREIPGVQLEVFIGNAREIMDKLDGNAVDFTIVDSQGGDRRHTALQMYEEEMWAVCAPEFSAAEKMTMAELCAERLLLREKGSGNRSCVESAFRMCGLTPSPAAESVSDLVLIRLAQSGFGAAILPGGIVENAVADGILRRISVSGGAFVRRYFLVSNDQKYQTDTVRRAIEILTKHTKTPEA